MRKLRIISVIIFIMASVLFGLYKKKEIQNRDLTGPKISMESDSITVSCDAEKADLLRGVHAEDAKDGDVSDSLMVESMSNFIEKGRRMVTIAAFDYSNNISKVTREITYSDYYSPRFSLTGPLCFPINTKNILQLLGAHDALDGDLTNNIKMSTEYYIQVDEEGIYPMIFTVANSAGDVSKLPVNVEIYDPEIKKSQPEIVLSEYLVYTEKENPIRPADYVEEMILGGWESLDEQEKEELKQKIEIEDNVDYETPGVYEVIYRYDASKEDENQTDPEEKEKHVGTVRLIVVVNE